MDASAGPFAVCARYSTEGRRENATGNFGEDGGHLEPRSDSIAHGVSPKQRGRSMSATDLVSRLHGVKDTGANKWIACCPAHDDKRPSLSITEQPDGRVLIHCFGGCGAEDVLVAVGLDWSAVMPESVETFARESVQTGRRRYSSRTHPPFNAHDVLRCLATEVTIVKLVASDLQRGAVLSEVDRERLGVAVSRILAAETLTNGC